MSVHQLPAAGGGLEPTLPTSWYRSDHVFALEKERIFCREWLCLGRLSLACDHAAVFILWPRDAGHTDISCHFLFEPGEIAKPDFEHADATAFWDVVNRQDWSICETVQLGLSSRVHERGFYAPMEDFNLDIRRYVMDRIGNAVGAL
jgi:phenylpropionate dioxygenase-like ring-hydroxylating dioxygenase large terminal subunit